MPRSEMTWRPIQEIDLAQCLAISPSSFGDATVRRAQAIWAWKQLISNPSFHGAVIEAQPPIAGCQIVGFGASVFVSPVFAERETGTPAPGLNSRIIASLVQGHSVVLDAPSLRRLNTHGGLSLVVLASASRTDILTPERTTEVRVQLAASFLTLHAGYRLKEMLSEACNAADVEHAQSTRVFRLASTFDSFHARHADNRWNRDRALFVMTRDDAMAMTGSIASIVFSYREPVLQLSSAEQLLLAAAVEGLTRRRIGGETGAQAHDDQKTVGVHI